MTDYMYGGVMSRNIATVKLRESYDPPQYNELREELFQETTIRVSGLLDRRSTSLRRTASGATVQVDANFETLYELSSPYPEDVTIDGTEYEILNVDAIETRAETRYVWLLRKA